MPTSLLHCYIEMMPRIQAQQMLDNTTSMGLAFGGGKEADKTLRMLQRMVKGEQVTEEEKSKVTGQQFAIMMGIPIRVKKKRK